MGKYYEREDLVDKGRKYCLAMLVECQRRGQPYITYGKLSAVIESQTSLSNIFDLHCGEVAGVMMNELLEYDEDIPPINAMVANQHGIPGEGVAGYINDAYPRDTKGDWLALTKDKKLVLLEKIRRDIRDYEHWEDALDELYGSTVKALLPKTKPKEKDGVRDGLGGGESDEHKNLKKWVSKNQTRIGVPQRAWLLEVEHKLLSGDIVDVVFTDGADFWPVEVKSIISNDADLEKGMYQCIKYREVLRAQQLPVHANVTSILVTERKLPSDLVSRRKILQVKTKTVKVN